MMPDDDWALGQNEVDVRNEARRNRMTENPAAEHLTITERFRDDLDDLDDLGQQIALCTNDERCQAAADEHDPGCPVEAQLMEDIGF